MELAKVMQMAEVVVQKYTTLYVCICNFNFVLEVCKPKRSKPYVKPWLYKICF